jgi:hypothetical protein
MRFRESCKRHPSQATDAFCQLQGGPGGPSTLNERRQGQTRRVGERGECSRAESAKAILRQAQDRFLRGR